MAYSLRWSVKAHSNDVRCLAVLDNSIISGSRDRVLKVWTENGKCYQETTAVSCHEKFISSVCALPPSKVFPQGLIFSGGHDNKIIGYIPLDNKPSITMTGHSGPVCCLTASRKQGHLISSSWDSTAKVWDISTGQCITTLFGHTQAIWCVIHMPEDFIVTGSADKIINIYLCDGTYVRSLHGHTDCVRCLTYLKPGIILSCGNDGSVIKWDVNAGSILEILSCHDSFIYSIVAQNSIIAFGGENNILSIWSDGIKGYNERQTIHLPAISVWAVAILPNSDIVVGSSDGYIRIYTKDQARMASKEEQAELEKSEIKKKVNGSSNTLNLPGKDALSVHGKNDGEIKLIHDSGTNYCYSWSAEKNDWTLIGEECAPPSDSSVCQAGLVPEIPKYYPPKKHVVFENYDVQLISKKLNEFMQQMNLKEEDAIHMLTSFKQLATPTDSTKVNSDLQVLNNALSEWPEAQVYPVLDITRICALSSVVHPIIFSNGNATSLFNSLNRFMTPGASVNNKMFLFRIFSNMFSREEGKSLIYSKIEPLLQILPELVTNNHKGLEVAASTFILNMSFTALTKNDLNGAKLCASSIQRIISQISDPEATFRMLVALGTIGTFQEAEILTQDLIKILKNVSACKSEDHSIRKVAECAEDILQTFSR